MSSDETGRDYAAPAATTSARVARDNAALLRHQYRALSAIFRAVEYRVFTTDELMRALHRAALDDRDANRGTRPRSLDVRSRLQGGVRAGANTRLNVTTIKSLRDSSASIARAARDVVANASVASARLADTRRKVRALRLEQARLARALTRRTASKERFLARDSDR